jgi:hypothetical protein
MHIMAAGLRQQGIQETEIEHALLGLDLLPGDRNLDRIGVHLLDRRPDLGQHGGPVAGVVHLGPQHQIGGAVDHEREMTVTGDQMGRGRRGRLG